MHLHTVVAFVQRGMPGELVMVVMVVMVVVAVVVVVVVMVCVVSESSGGRLTETQRHIETHRDTPQGVAGTARV